MNMEQIYKDWYSTVLRYSLSLTKNLYLAEDITSETFYKAALKLDTFRGENAIGKWLKTVARNCYLNYKRDLVYMEALDDLNQYEISEELIPDATKHQALILRTIIHDLPMPYKEVVMWRILSDMSHKSIGDLFGKSEGWSAITYHRAQKKIREDERLNADRE